MESHDLDALKGFIWLVLIWWWLWGRAWSARETPRETIDEAGHRPVQHSRTIIDNAMARADATPRSWSGYFAALGIWFTLAKEIDGDSI